MSENPGPGRPSKYKEEFCQQLIEHMASGLSFESFAAVIHVNRDTLYAWEKEFQEFSDAKKTALDQNLLFWEKLGIDHVLNESHEEESEENGTYIKKSKALNHTVWIFNMKNRHKWRDKQPDESDVVVNNFTQLTDDDLQSKIQEKLKKLGGDSGE